MREVKVMPVGWARVSLGEVASFEMGQAPPGSASNFSGQGTVFVKAGEFGKDYPVVREWTTAPLKYAKAGDVLICVVGATAGKLNLGIDCAIGRSVAAIRPQDAVLQKTLYRQLQARVGAMRAESTGSAQGVISKEMLAELSIAVPPLREQERIADKLDTVLARVDACRDRLTRVAPLLKRFRQSVLTVATSGQLTEDWRLENCDTPCARETTLGAVILDMRNGLSPKPRETPPGARILRISSVRPGRIDFDDHRFLEVDPRVASLYDVRRGDLLFTRYNGSLDFVGVCAVVLADQPGFVYPDKLIRVRVDTNLALPRYIEIAYGSPSVRKQVEEFVKSSAGQKGIAGGDLKITRFPLPSKNEQAEIVRRVETLFAFADRLEARLAEAHAAVDRLTASLLAKAFRGELVPQDPNDEPASALLARIAAAGSAAPPTRRSRSPRAGRAPRAPKESATMTKSRQDDDVMGQPYLAGHLRRIGTPATAEVLFKVAELPVGDFYKQLAWEVAQGHVKDNQTTLEPGHAAG